MKPETREPSVAQAQSTPSFRLRRRNIALAAQIPLLHAEGVDDEELNGNAQTEERREDEQVVAVEQMAKEEEAWASSQKSIQHDNENAGMERNLSACLSHWTEGRTASAARSEGADTQPASNPASSMVASTIARAQGQHLFLPHSILLAIADPPPWARI